MRAQVQMAALQAQQLAWQQDNLAARLASLRAAAARVDVNQLLKARPRRPPRGQAAGRAPWPRARRGAGACTVGAGRRVVGLAEDAAARPRRSGARGAAGTPNPNFTPQEELAGRLAGAEAELAGLAADLAARDAEAAALARALAGARRALGVGGAPSGAGGAQRWHAGRMPAPLSMRRRGRTYQRCERCGSVSRGGTFPSIAAMQPHISWLHLLQY